MAGVGNYEIVTQVFGPYTTSGDKTLTVDAPAGKSVFFGWVSGISPGNNGSWNPQNSHPNADGSAWVAGAAVNSSGVSTTITVSVVCAEMGACSS